MEEGFKKEKQKPLSPWAVEPGGPVDMLEQSQKKETQGRAFEKETLLAFHTQLKEVVKTDGGEYEVEDSVDGMIFSIDKEYFSRFTTHVKNLLKDANSMLAQHQKPFRIRFHMKGPKIEGKQDIELKIEKPST